MYFLVFVDEAASYFCDKCEARIVRWRTVVATSVEEARGTDTQPFFSLSLIHCISLLIDFRCYLRVNWDWQVKTNTIQVYTQEIVAALCSSRSHKK